MELKPSSLVIGLIVFMLFFVTMGLTYVHWSDDYGIDRNNTDYQNLNSALTIFKNDLGNTTDIAATSTKELKAEKENSTQQQASTTISFTAAAVRSIRLMWDSIDIFKEIVATILAQLGLAQGNLFLVAIVTIVMLLIIAAVLSYLSFLFIRGAL